MRLLKDVYLVGSGRTGIGISDPYDCHVYLIDGGDEAALIDAGSGVDIAPILRNIAEDGVALSKVRGLILTHAHADHGGASALFREQLGCRVMVGADEVHIVETGDAEASGLNVALPTGIYPPGYQMRPCPVDRVLREGEVIRVGKYSLSVLHTPGHSPGSVCLLTEADGRQVMFTGDTIQFCPVAGLVGWISMLNAPGTDLDAYRCSTRRLAAQRVDVLLPGHRVFALSHGQLVIESVARGFDGLSIPRSVI